MEGLWPRLGIEMLFLEAPHGRGHFVRRHPLNMPVEKQAVTAVLVPGSCDPPASGDVLAITTRSSIRVNARCLLIELVL